MLAQLLRPEGEGICGHALIRRRSQEQHGVVTVETGASYDVRSQVFGPPERPAALAGTLAVY